MPAFKPVSTGEERRRAWRRVTDRPALAALIVTVVLSAVFLAFPGLDQAVTRMFHGPDGFAAASHPALLALRLAGRVVTRLAILAIAILWLAKIFVPERVAAVDLRAILFLTATLALGPGLVVNLVLKEFWHRPRPQDTDLYGGAHPFGLPWMWEGGCRTDCSFPSAESSASMWLVAVALVMPPARRRLVLAAALVWALVISGNRIAFGGHYLSDVLIAWSLTLLVVFVMRDLILIRTEPATVSGWEAALARFGRRFPGMGGPPEGPGGGEGSSRP